MHLQYVQRPDPNCTEYAAEYFSYRCYSGKSYQMALTDHVKCESFRDGWYSIMLSSCIFIVSFAICAHKDDYLYRKITGIPHFNERTNDQTFRADDSSPSVFSAEGSAFILIAALDQIDHNVVIDALNILFDENAVKEYATNRYSSHSFIAQRTSR